MIFTRLTRFTFASKGKTTTASIVVLPVPVGHWQNNPNLRSNNQKIKQMISGHQTKVHFFVNLNTGEIILLYFLCNMILTISCLIIPSVYLHRHNAALLCREDESVLEMVSKAEIIKTLCGNSFMNLHFMFGEEDFILWLLRWYVLTQTTLYFIISAFYSLFQKRNIKEIAVKIANFNSFVPGRKENLLRFLFFIFKAGSVVGQFRLWTKNNWQSFLKFFLKIFLFFSTHQCF